MYATWQGYSDPRGEVTKAVARLLLQFVAKLPNLWRDYLWRGYLVARLLASIDIKVLFLLIYSLLPASNNYLTFKHLANEL